MNESPSLPARRRRRREEEEEWCRRLESLIAPATPRCVCVFVCVCVYVYVCIHVYTLENETRVGGGGGRGGGEEKVSTFELGRGWKLGN